MVTETIVAWAPLLVVLTVWIAFAIYASRKQRRLASVAAADRRGPIDAVSIVRGADPTAILRRYKVLLDGSSVGTIGAGEVKHFSVAPGRHTISVKIDWCESAPFAVEKSANANLVLRCGAKFNDWRCWVMPFIQPRQYIYLTHDGS